MSSSTETFEAKLSFSHLLELAADNDVEGFKQCIESNPSAIDEIGLWYSRQVDARGMVLEYKTPLMVAAMYGSLDVMEVILSHSEVDVNRSCGPDKSTALHCAAFGGSIDAVKLLLVNGANPNLADRKGSRPYDVINVSPMLPEVRVVLEDLLSSHGFIPTLSESKSKSLSSEKKEYPVDPRISVDGLKVDSLFFPTLSESESLPSGLEAPSSPMAFNCNDNNVPPVSEKKEFLVDPRVSVDGLKVDSLFFPTLSEGESLPSGLEFPSSPMTSKSEKKEYPVDPSLPDIKNSIYGTDEFRMYSFKIRPCSRAYSHDWTECPFVHPGENARRRDPRKYHYSCVPCPDFRKGSCRRGDMCEYSHGVFECWLHPAQYRTRLCKDGTNCNRRVCFFAHTHDELRPLYASTGSGVPSPRSLASATSVMDMASAMSIFPGSPSSSPSPFTPPMSPSGNGMSHIPTLHLPGSNIQANNMQTSRLRSYLNARDIQQAEDLEFEQRHILNDMSCFSPSGNRLNRLNSPAPSNLDEFFSSEISSPRLNPFHQQQRMLSPINTKVFSPKSIDHPLLQASLGLSSPGIRSPRGIEAQSSPLSARLSALALHDRQQHIRSLSARDLGANVPRDLIPEGAGIGGSHVGSWSNWEFSNGRPDWSINDDELSRLKRSYTSGHNGEEPDLSWVQSLVKDSSSENKEVHNNNNNNTVSSTKLCGDGSNSDSQVESVDHYSLGMA